MAVNLIQPLSAHQPSIAKIAASVAASAVCMCALLVGSDKLLGMVDPSYQPSSDVLVATIIFVPAAFLLGFILRQKRVVASTYLLLAASASFLPAVFLAAAVSIILGRPMALLDNYNIELCGENAGPPYCGPAFSHYIFTRTIRAFPTILGIPYIYSFLAYDRRSPFVKME